MPIEDASIDPERAVAELEAHAATHPSPEAQAAAQHARMLLLPLQLTASPAHREFLARGIRREWIEEVYCAPSDSER